MNSATSLTEDGEITSITATTVMIEERQQKDDTSPDFPLKKRYLKGGLIRRDPSEGMAVEGFKHRIILKEGNHL
jgi:hypothetical protein